MFIEDVSGEVRFNITPIYGYQDHSAQWRAKCFFFVVLEAKQNHLGPTRPKTWIFIQILILFIFFFTAKILFYHIDYIYG